jgi:hypothetical protein
MLLAGCGGSGSPSAGKASGGASALTSTPGVPTVAGTTNAAGSPGVAGGSPSGGSDGNGNAAVGLLPSASLTGTAGAAITTACKDAGTAWSTFRSSYGAATSNPQRATSAATAGSALSDVVQELTHAVSTDAPPAYFLKAQDVVRRGTAVSKDLQNLSHDLQSGDTNAAAMLYSSSNPLSPVQLDAASLTSTCGT